MILIVGLTIFVFFGQTVGKVFKWSWRGLLHIGIGFLLLFLFNMIGSLIDLTIPLNFMTALFVGFLGLPGLITLILIKLIII